MTAIELEVLWLKWEVITMSGRTELHICRVNVTGLYYTDNVMKLIASYARPHRNAFIFQDGNARVHVCVSKITCNVEESGLSHDQRSPQPCLQLSS